MANWNKNFMDLAFHVSQWSKDRSTKVGAVIVDDKKTVISMGYNGFPRGCDDDKEERHERPMKYLYTEHAEKNAIYNAARNGNSLDGKTLYVTTLFPCVDCAKAIIQSGIKKVVATKPDFDHERWGESFKVSLELFRETDVIVEYYE